MGLTSRTTTLTFLTASVLASSSPTPEAPGTRLSGNVGKHNGLKNAPPVTTTTCSPQSRGGGPKRMLAWFRYNREYHLIAPARERGQALDDMHNVSAHRR